MSKVDTNDVLSVSLIWKNPLASKRKRIFNTSGGQVVQGSLTVESTGRNQVLVLKFKSSNSSNELFKRVITSCKASKSLIELKGYEYKSYMNSIKYMTSINGTTVQWNDLFAENSEDATKLCHNITSLLDQIKIIPKDSNPSPKINTSKAAVADSPTALPPVPLSLSDRLAALKGTCNTPKIEDLSTRLEALRSSNDTASVITSSATTANLSPVDLIIQQAQEEIALGVIEDSSSDSKVSSEDDSFSDSSSSEEDNDY